jgi:hypothetical protein
MALAIVAAATTLSCQSVEPGVSGDPCGPNYWPSRYTVIGPAGGETGLGYYSTPGDQVRLLVPAGKWAQCWEVRVDGDYGDWTTPTYPSGFVPSQYATLGSVSISIYRRSPAGDTIYAPDSMYVELSFPLLSIPSDSQHFLAAFNYDGTAADWRVRLPDALDQNFLTVHVSDWKRPWWFGRINPAKVNFDRYVAPALADRIGTATWNQIQAVMDSIANAAVLRYSCAGMNLLQDLFVALMNTGAARVDSLQAGLHCGTCDALTAVFWSEWKVYVERLQAANLVNFLTTFIPEGSYLADLAGEALVFALESTASSGLACNYDCYFGSMPMGKWYFGMAEYGVGAVLAYLIQEYKTVSLGCAAGTSAAPHPASWPRARGAPGRPATPPCAGGVAWSAVGAARHASSEIRLP